MGVRRGRVWLLRSEGKPKTNSERRKLEKTQWLKRQQHVELMLCRSLSSLSVVRNKCILCEIVWVTTGPNVCTSVGICSPCSGQDLFHGLGLDYFRQQCTSNFVAILGNGLTLKDSTSRHRPHQARSKNDKMRNSLVLKDFPEECSALWEIQLIRLLSQSQGWRFDPWPLHILQCPWEHGSELEVACNSRRAPCMAALSTLVWLCMCRTALYEEHLCLNSIEDS